MQFYLRIRIYFRTEEVETFSIGSCQLSSAYLQMPHREIKIRFNTGTIEKFSTLFVCCFWFFSFFGLILLNSDLKYSRRIFFHMIDISASLAIVLGQWPYKFRQESGGNAKISSLHIFGKFDKSKCNALQAYMYCFDNIHAT